jgi:hypothetical protein
VGEEHRAERNAQQQHAIWIQSVGRHWHVFPVGQEQRSSAGSRSKTVLSLRGSEAEKARNSPRAQTFFMEGGVTKYVSRSGWHGNL